MGGLGLRWDGNEKGKWVLFGCFELERETDSQSVRKGLNETNKAVWMWLWMQHGDSFFWKERRKWAVERARGRRYISVEGVSVRALGRNPARSSTRFPWASSAFCCSNCMFCCCNCIRVGCSSPRHLWDRISLGFNLRNPELKRSWTPHSGSHLL